MITAFRSSSALFLDVEMTCWEHGPPSGEVPEIIEVGIVDFDVATLSIKREGQFYCRPRLSSVSNYCSELTGITPELLKEQGRPFPEVTRSLAKDWGIGSKTLLTWGNDWNAIDAECIAAGCPNPFPRDGAINMGQIFNLLHGSRNRMGMIEAMRFAGVEPVGKLHSGLADAKNLALLFARYSGDFRARRIAVDDDPEPAAGHFL